ncbi:MAG: hypothetical protein AAF604_13850 [Acidobacteriota bacterium]
MKRLSLIAAIALLGVVVTTPAFACMQSCWPFCINETIPTATIMFPESGKAMISITGYETTDVEPNNSCIVALPPVDGVLAVETVVNYDSTTGQPFDWVDFGAAKIPGRELARLAEDQGLVPDDTSWHGFLTRVTASIEAGTPNHFILEVTLDPRVSPWDFVQALRSDGIFATSSSDAIGNPTSDHNHFVHVSSLELVVIFPPVQP